MFEYSSILSNEVLEISNLLLSEVQRAIELKSHDFSDFFASRPFGFSLNFLVAFTSVCLLGEDSRLLKQFLRVGGGIWARTSGGTSERRR